MMKRNKEHVRNHNDDNAAAGGAAASADRTAGAADASDVDMDTLLTALAHDFAERGPLVAMESDDAGDERDDERAGEFAEGPAGEFAEGVDFDGAFTRFMVSATGKAPAPRMTLGDRVLEFRDDASLEAFALRFGVSRAELLLLESSRRVFDPAGDNDRDVAVAAAGELDLPPLKVLRVLKAMRAHAPSASLEQPHALLLAARSKPPGNDDDR